MVAASLHARALRERVLAPTIERYPGKDELIELLGLVLCAGENILIVGPPGTAKSEIASEVAARLGGRYFEYLLTRFTEPAELFGPVDLAALREGRFVTATAGMLPEAEIVFLDEVFHAGSAILNTLLSVLSTGVYRRGAESKRTELISVIGATNRVADDPALRALEDRFTVRVLSQPLVEERIPELLNAGWRLEQERMRGVVASRPADPPLGTATLRALASAVADVDVTAIVEPLRRLIVRWRGSGVDLSDRRAIKLQRLAAASAVLCGRDRAQLSDLWPARYLWRNEDESSELADAFDAFVEEERDRPASAPPGGADHPLALRGPALRELLIDLGRLETEVEQLADGSAAAAGDLRHRIHDLDRLRRWCRIRSLDDELLLRDLGSRLDSLSSSLDRKVRSP